MKINNSTPNSTIFNELGSRLSRIRKQQGYTQNALAKEAGIGVATLRRIEDGQDSQLGSWLKVLKTLQMAESIEALLPTDFHSPMAEVLGKRGRQYRIDSTEPGHVDQNKPTRWGDEAE